MIFMILAASNALDGALAGYRPPTFQFWERGAWQRGSWGMNDEWLPGGGGPPPVVTTDVTDILRVKRHRIGGRGGR